VSLSFALASSPDARLESAAYGGIHLNDIRFDYAAEMRMCYRL
jgi:hypothetical protein